MSKELFKAFFLMRCLKILRVNKITSFISPLPFELELIPIWLMYQAIQMVMMGAMDASLRKKAFVVLKKVRCEN